MADAGADLVGVNCHFDGFASIEAMEVMKTALEHSGHMKNPDFHLAVQPVVYWTPECSTPEGKQGFIDLPDFPFALEPRVNHWQALVTRDDKCGCMGSDTGSRGAKAATD